MNLLLLLAHSVAEYDDLRMFADLGYDPFSIGAYANPQEPADGLRPALPNVPYHPDLAAAVEGDQMAHKENLPELLLEWADAVIVHHYPEPWLLGQFDRFRAHGVRTIWRTCGQSDVRLEAAMRPYRERGLEIVRYSPREEIAFEEMGVFAGQDAMIRFGKYPADWSGWTGRDAVVGNITQNMAGRGAFVGYDFWRAATEGLAVRPAGPGSEALRGGVGALGYNEMRQYLRNIRAYLYTGTQPASYTLGLIEALLTGVPIVSIGKGRMWVPELFEGDEFVVHSANDPLEARHALRFFLDHPNETVPAMQRFTGRQFDVATVGPQWVDFLGAP